MEYLKIAIVLLGIVHVIRLYLLGKKARAKAHSTHYFNDSQANDAPWRWRIPHESLALEIVDTKEKSTIHFVPKFNASDHIITACGFSAYIGAIVFVVFGLYLSFFGGATESWRAPIAFFFAIMLCFLGMAAISTGQRVLSLLRKPNGLILQYSYGAWWVRSVYIGKHVNVLIEIKNQSLIDYDTFQKEPFYVITIKALYWFSFSPSKFYITANPEQIAWIQEGLIDFFTPTEEPNI